MKKLLAAASVDDIFGKVTPPGDIYAVDAGTGLSNVISVSIRIGLFIGGLLLLGYLFYGAFLWITSNGEEEQLKKARDTMTQAIVGIILLIVALSAFVVIAGNVLGIVTIDGGGNIYFNLPSVSGN